MWQQEIGEYTVHFHDQVDEFAHHVSMEIGDQGFGNARGSDGTSPIELGPPLSGEVTSVLLIHPLDGGRVRCVVQGDGDEAGADQVEPWQRAAAEAAAALGNRNRAHSFEAVIGPVEYPLDNTGQLAHPHRIGPLQLVSGGVHMREFVNNPEQITGGAMMRYTTPVIVSGAVTVHTWRAGIATAEWAVRRVCALMTLATGSLWTPRIPPRERTDDSGPLTVPATVGQTPAPDPHRAWTGEIPEGTPSFELNPWTEGAWQLLAANKHLDQALEAHYQAVRLDFDGHSSAAYLLFVATIEGFGERLVEDAVCGCHPQCQHPKPVAQKRFRKALKTVMTNKQVEQLAANAYNLRSRTGHTGALFGAERTFGHPGFNLAGLPDSYFFEGPLLSEIRWASRRVLLKSLGAPEPERLVGD